MKIGRIDHTKTSYSRWKFGGIAGLLLLLAVLFLPAVQSALYVLLIRTPSIPQWGIVAVLIAALGVWRNSPAIVLLAPIVFVVLGLLVGPVAGGVYAATDLADEMQSDATELETLPNTSADAPRVLPRSVSDNYAQSSMQYPQYQLTGSDITYRNATDTYAWSHGLRPGNPMVALLGHQIGALYVDMTTTGKRVSVEETTFQNGRGQLVFDSYAYQSVLHTPLARHNWDTTFNARAEGTSYIAHSTTVHEWRFRLSPLPQFYAVPQHGSVEVMTADGEISSLSPQEAQSNPLLRGQNFYPYDLAVFRVESMQYIHGALNKWFWKEDVLALSNLSESGNNWPIAVPTESDTGEPELTYFIATEPTGSGDGVYEVWTFDGQTGAAGVQKYSDSQIGPQKAVDFVERRSEVNRLSNAEAVAPIPIVNGDTLYWHVKVVPQSESGVIYTAFVNAESGDVTLVEGDEPIYAFLSQSEVRQVGNATDDGGQAPSMSVTVVVTDADGEIVGTRNITVPEGGSVDVTIQDETANNSTDTGEQHND